MKTGKAVLRHIVLLVVLLFVARAGFSQEEHHQHTQHKHPKYAKIKNPIAKTEQSVDSGKKLYEKHCITCHGESGKGGIGPKLTGSVRIHGSSDGEMFHVITDGVAGTAMKGHKNELAEEMRWHLVNYISSLATNRVNK